MVHQEPMGGVFHELGNWLKASPQSTALPASPSHAYGTHHRQSPFP